MIDITIDYYCIVSPVSHMTGHMTAPPLYRMIKGAVRDNKKAGVLEPAVSKIKSLKFATEAAITILRIDDMIKLAPEKREEGSYGDAVARGEL